MMLKYNTMIDEWWILKDLESSRHNLARLIYWNIPGGTEEKQKEYISVRMSLIDRRKNNYYKH
jgi:hypothetical protein